MIYLKLMMKAIVCIIALTMAGYAASDNECRGGGFTSYSNDYRVYRVNVEKAYYYYDWDECPLKGNCKKNRSLTNGGLALVFKFIGNEWACVRNLEEDKIRHGWMKLSDLSRVSEEDKVNSLLQWAGRWSNSKTNFLEFSIDKKELSVNGSATWYGGEHASNTNGRIKGELKLSDDIKSAYVRSGSEVYDCQVTMELITPKYMIVKDNKKCGGTNVRFDGVYTKE